jgi:hypothetical protein
MDGILMKRLDGSEPWRWLFDTTRRRWDLAARGSHREPGRRGKGCSGELSCVNIEGDEEDVEWDLIAFWEKEMGGLL